ncbi:hypothetical protein DKX38_022513 [Salix brachista]|uniref:BZIP domain-containing protein n=1 Tax=Salix brachista TaxID=2182728 RepID=A0A5N5K2U8_9ROSI|nr:hypothetical protein DKX38_022513 [Salix brachista]
MEPHNKIKKFHGLPHADSVHNLFTFPKPTQKQYPSATSQPIDESTNYSSTLANISENPESSSSLLDKFLTNSLFHVPLHILSPNTSSLSTDSTVAEPRDEQLGICNDKKLRRMISNRESARRSRMRRKKQIEDLQYRVNQLQNMNHQLSEKVIHLLETNHQTLQENSQIKEKVSSLQVVLSDLLTPLSNVDEGDCNSIHLKGETSNR